MKIKPFAVAAIFITIAAYIWYMAENNAGFSDSMFNKISVPQAHGFNRGLGTVYE